MTTETRIRPREGLLNWGIRSPGPPGPLGGRSEELRTHQNASPEWGKRGIGTLDGLVQIRVPWGIRRPY
jgi:hypothetical protein